MLLNIGTPDAENAIHLAVGRAELSWNSESPCALSCWPDAIQVVTSLALM
jgi:hypothetical protein